MPAGPVSPELRSATISGARWTGLARLTREVIAFGATIVLARLLAPAEFGDAAIALVVVALTAILGTAGCTAALVQRPELSDRLVGAAVLLCAVVASVLTLATIVAAWLLVRPIFGDRTADLVLLAAPAWLLMAVGSPSQALLQRRLRFRALAIVDSVAAASSALAAVALAVAGVGGAALVVGGLVLVGTTGLLALGAERPASIRADRAAMRDTLGFVTPLALSSLVYLGYRNVDYLIIGARSTSTQLGFYWRAFQLGVVYQSKISNIMQRVSFPVFARATTERELRALHDRIVRTHATVLVPLLASFIAAAPVLIPWLFGSAWEPAVRPAQIMAVAGMAEAIMAGIGPLMVALGRPGVLLRWNLAVLGVYAVMIYVLAPHGIQVVAIGVATFGVLALVGTQAFIRRPFANLTFRDLWAETRAGILVGAVVLTAGTGVREALEAVGMPSLGVLALLGLATLLLYGGCLKAFFPAAWLDLRATFRSVGGSRSGVAVRLPDG